MRRRFEREALPPGWEARFWKFVEKTDDCWLWTGTRHGGRGKGYGVFTIRKPVTAKAHRVAWIAQNGPIPDELSVQHSCKNLHCVRIEHLYLDTAQYRPPLRVASDGYYWRNYAHHEVAGHRRYWDPRSGRYRLDHVMVWEYHNGPVPEGFEIHHINCDPLDNRLENLKPVTRSEHLLIHSAIRRAESVKEAIA